VSSHTSPIEIVIRVQGSLNPQTAATLGLFSDTQTETDEPAITTLTGALLDEAALDSVLDQLYALGLPLISVEREEADRAASTGTPAPREVDEPDQFT
jgi:hypothetical protein